MKTLYSTPYIIELAQDFWKKAGGTSSWPCDLDQAVAISLPIDVVSLSSLSVKEIEKWFCTRKFSYQFSTEDLSLHGFIIVTRGKGLIFINGSDSKEERLFTLAHEIAHFIIDYQLPRLKACNLFGKQILDVLDGLRAPTIQELVDGILLSIEIKPYIHLIEKNNNSYGENTKVWRSEDQADALAIELLAPFKSVYADLKKMSFPSFINCYTAAYQLLSIKYGLPVSVTQSYAQYLAYKVTGGPSTLESLGLI